MRCAAVMADGFHTCGSYAFNLLRNGIDQGALCDVHYWQSQADRLKALNAELAAALELMVEAYCDDYNDHFDPESALNGRKALEACSVALAKNKGDIA